MHYKLYILAAAVIVFSSCRHDINLRPQNGTTLISQTWSLNASDTSKILIQQQNYLLLNTFHDSLLNRTDTIYYKHPEETGVENIFGKIDQLVINSRNRNNKEFYRIEKDRVYLSGYATGDSINPYIVFNPPIIVQSAEEVIKDSVISQMKTWNNIQAGFGEGINIKSVVELKRKGSILINNKVEEFYLYELTIIQDKVLPYGDHNLVLPEAVVMKSNLLFGSISGLIAEWIIRTRKKEKDNSGVKNCSQEPNLLHEDLETYLELIRYRK